MIKFILLVIIIFSAIEVTAQSSVFQKPDHLMIISQFINKKSVEFKNVNFDPEELIILKKNNTDFVYTGINMKDNELSGNIEFYGSLDSGVLWICYPEEYHVMTKRFVSYKWFEYSYKKITYKTHPESQGDTSGTNSNFYYNFAFREMQNNYCPPYPSLSNEIEKKRNKIVLQQTSDWFHVPYNDLNIALGNLLSEFFPYKLVHWPTILADTNSMRYIHQKYQKEDTSEYNKVRSLIRNQRPGDISKIHERVTNGWVSSTLRGYINYSGSSPEGDFPSDHTYRFNNRSGDSKNDNDLEFIPNVIENPKPMFPYYREKFERACDWCLHLIPDPDMRYMKSCANNNYIEVEIERFALDKNFRPSFGDYCQVTGRWVIDAGHSIKLTDESGNKIEEYRSEIHPPELVVSTSYNDSSTCKTRIITTGAWRGENLTFFIYPPPRPNFRSKLQIDTVHILERYAKLYVRPVPEINPNHYECNIRLTDNSIIRDYKSSKEGVMFFQDNYAYKGIIKTKWVEDFSENEFVTKTEKSNLYKVYGKIFINSYSGNLDSTKIYIGKNNKTAVRSNPVSVNEQGEFSFDIEKGRTYVLYPYNKDLRFDSIFYNINYDKFFPQDSAQKPQVLIMNAFTIDKSFIEPGVNSGNLQIINKINVKDLSAQEKENLIKQLNHDLVRSMACSYIDSGKLNLVFYLHLSMIGNFQGLPMKIFNDETGYTEIPKSTETSSNNYENKIKYYIDTAFALYRVGREITALYSKKYVILKGSFSNNSSAHVITTVLFSENGETYRIQRSKEVDTDKDGNIKLRIENIPYPGYIKLKFEVVRNYRNPWYLPALYSDSVYVPKNISGSMFTIKNESIKEGSIKAKLKIIHGFENLTLEEKMDLEFLDSVKDFYELQKIRTKYFARKTREEE